MRTTEELVRLVPATLREGALALGATRARAVFTVVVPAALPGILTGILLALARIAGETAPLLFTAFNNRFWSTDVRGADLNAHRPGVHLRDRPLRGVASAGMGRRSRARRDGAGVLHTRAAGDGAHGALTTRLIGSSVQVQDRATFSRAMRSTMRRWISSRIRRTSSGRLALSGLRAASLRRACRARTGRRRRSPS